MNTKNIFLIFLLMVGPACSNTSKLSTKKGKWKPLLQVQAGINKGGIAENTDFTSSPEIPVDGFTGATKIGKNIGAHVLFPVGKNAFETGIDFMYNPQTFTYNDAENGYFGKRDIGVSQFLFPVTYNIGIFKLKNNQSLLYLKLGYVLELNLLSVDDSGINLPAYSYKYRSSGMAFGISTTAIKLGNGAHLGFYIDGYRGSKIFNDFYNTDAYENPGSSYYKLGLIYQFK
ncbi:MAG: hypothetical protein VB110_04535 [Bacteroidales bacterium]|nr:hypothetical protein [Bacteroidales bacterium]